MSTKRFSGIFAISMSALVCMMNGRASFAESESAAQPSSVTNQTAKEVQDVTAPKPAVKMKEDLPNFHEVHPFLFRGGEPNEVGLQKLKDMGIATIIDLRAPLEMKIDERGDAQKLGMRYINLVMDSHAPTEKQVDEMMKEIDKAKTLSDQGEKNKKIFVHCAHGSDRTGCMMGIWRVTRDNYDYPTAYKEMRKYYFTPKFTRLSGAVEKYAAKPDSSTSSTGPTSKEQ
jgi:rhodanese-related sulfurtransferase